MTLIRDHRLLIFALLVGLAALLVTLVAVDHHTAATHASAAVDYARSSWGKLERLHHHLHSA